MPDQRIDHRDARAGTDGTHPVEQQLEARAPGTLGRRDFLTTIGLAAAGFLAGCSADQREEFFKRRFVELSPEQMARRLDRLQRRYQAEYGAAVALGATAARPETAFGYALDLARCIGCRRCVYGCVQENNQSREPQVHWIRVLELRKDKGIDLHYANPYYDPATVPEPDKFYMPVACLHCRNAPCVQVCPVGATYPDPDGIVVIDYDWCIGCRCCMAACPYGARSFNWGDPRIPDGELNPNLHVLGNRPRPRGVVEKCTFCVQRVRDGRYPACVEICPVGARKFGNLLDPEDEVSRVLRDKRVFVLKVELRTDPAFYYFYG